MTGKAQSQASFQMQLAELVRQSAIAPMEQPLAPWWVPQLEVRLQIFLAPLWVQLAEAVQVACTESALGLSETSKGQTGL